jgi:hypothetical protein
MSQHAHEIALAAREVEGVEISPGEDLVVVEGPLWVTRAEDNRDIVLGAGERLNFARKTRAIVGGLRQMAVRLRIEPHAA